MIIIKLDTPILDEGGEISELKFETPIRAGHILKAMRASTSPALISEMFIESICGVSRGFLERLTLEDFAKVQAAVNPFLASFQRLQSGEKS